MPVAGMCTKNQTNMPRKSRPSLLNIKITTLALKFILVEFFICEKNINVRLYLKF